MSRKVQGATVRGAKSSRYGKKRLDPDQREKLILEGAGAYFAKHGFEGRTRWLAKHLGISQPLLYRYFPSMSVLVDRVYDSIYVGRWKAEWQEIIADRSRSLDDCQRRTKTAHLWRLKIAQFG